MLGCAAVLTAFFTGELHWPLWLVVIGVTTVVGVLAGALNGLFVVRIGINAFIGTLGVSTILDRADARGVGRPDPQHRAEPLVDFVQYQILGLAVPSISASCSSSRFGTSTNTRRSAAICSSSAKAGKPRALSGCRVDRLRFGAFVASGAISAVAGIITAGQLGAADPSVGPSFLLPAYAAAFLGATTIKPGRFNAWGTVVALYLLVTGVTGLELLGSSSWVQEMFNGAALLVAVTFARFVAQDQAS